MVYQLGICELFAPPIHGLTNDSSRGIMENFMISEFIYLNEFYDFSYVNMINLAKRKWINAKSIGLINCTYKHPIVRNFNSIVDKKQYISIDIVDVKILERGEFVGIKKTFWLKIIQRLYKKVYRERERIIALRKYPSVLHYKNLYGIWPKYCIRLPEYKFFNIS